MAARSHAFYDTILIKENSDGVSEAVRRARKQASTSLGVERRTRSLKSREALLARYLSIRTGLRTTASVTKQRRYWSTLRLLRWMTSESIREPMAARCRIRWKGQSRTLKSSRVR